MQGRRIVSVAASDRHCLALSREGEVYSWGDEFFGSLGHADGGERAVPSRVESLSRIECIAAGDDWTSAAVDEDGRLFTWGRAINPNDETMLSGLGYALDSETESQLTPKWVETLSEDCVVGITLGYAFTLVVTTPAPYFLLGTARMARSATARSRPKCCPGGSKLWRKRGADSSPFLQAHITLLR